MKRLVFAYIFAGVLSISCPALSDVEKLSVSDYFPAVDKALGEAKESIFLVMYYVDFRKYEPESVVSILINDLVKAKDRGVGVKVILDQTVIFSARGGSVIGGERTKAGGKKMVKEEKNKRAFNYLKANGINVMYDNLEIYTHGKCVVVDGETVILGSHNWTKNSLMRSNEYSVLIKSKELAEELLKDFEKIQIDHEASKQEAEEYVELNKDVMINILSGFVSNSNNYCWDVYMYLAGHYSPDTEIEFDYDKVAEYLGIKDKMSKENYREMLGYHTLRQLQDRYGLVEYIPIKGQNAKVKLADSVERIADSKNKEIYFEIPKKFWDYGWDRRLSLSGQFCYFVNLVEGGVNHNPWAMSKKNLVEKYKVGKERISEGMAELRRWNLVEVEYGDIDFGKGYGWRLPNRYRLKDLYRIEDFERELQKLYGKYGREKVEQARGWAKIIFCENNLVDVEEIVRMANEYGAEKAADAFNVIANRSLDNPKRSISYIIGILKNGKSRQKAAGSRIINVKQ